MALTYSISFEVPLVKSEIESLRSLKYLESSITNDLDYLIYLKNNKEMLSKCTKVSLYDICKHYTVGLSALNKEQLIEKLMKRIDYTISLLSQADASKNNVPLLNTSDKRTTKVLTNNELKYLAENDKLKWTSKKVNGEFIVYLKDNIHLVSRLTKEELIACMSTVHAIKTVHKMELLYIITCRIFYTYKQKVPQKVALSGIGFLTDNRYLAYVNDFPIGLFTNEKEAIIAHDVACQFITGNKNLCHRPDTNKLMIKKLNIRNEIKQALIYMDNKLSKANQSNTKSDVSEP